MPQENKKSFFIVKIKKSVYNAIQDNEEKFFDRLTLIVSAKPHWYVFMSDFEVVLFFSRATRTRAKALQSRISSLVSIDDESINFQCEGLSRDIYVSQLSYHRNNSRYRLTREPMMESYSAKDLEMFENFDNLYEWQKELYNKILYLDTGEFKIPNSREIMSIVDKEGKKGKSSFVKWLCYNYPMDIARLSFGTASQLRSAVFNMGKRKCYIIDLPRTKGRGDSIFDLLSVIEDMKNGFISSSMYGADKQLMMDPPFVIVFSNNPLPYNSLSQDRWDLYTLSDQKELVKMQNLYSGEEEEKDNKEDISTKETLT